MEMDQPKLIAEIKKRPGLWSMKHPTDRDEKLVLWKEVGAAMYRDWGTLGDKAKAYDRVLFLQRKWRSLRDAYRRELRAQNTGIRTHKTIYRYFKMMSFLGGMGHCSSNTNEQEEEEEEINDIVEHDNKFENNDEETVIVALEGDEKYLISYNDTDPDPLRSTSKSSKPVKKRSSRLKSKKRKMDSSSIEDMDDNQELEMPIYSLDERERERDADVDVDSESDKLFLMSFVPEMKQLPVNIKMWARAQIANIMQEAVSCQYNNTSPKKSGIKRQRFDSLE